MRVHVILFPSNCPPFSFYFSASAAKVNPSLTHKGHHTALFSLTLFSLYFSSASVAFIHLSTYGIHGMANKAISFFVYVRLTNGTTDERNDSPLLLLLLCSASIILVEASTSREEYRIAIAIV